MSCFPESTYAVYIDGELAVDEQRLVDAHLVSCRSCRVLVSALRDEAALLGDVLHERAPQWQTAAARPVQEPGLATGLPLAIAAATIAISVLGVLAELHWPGGLSLLNPLRLKGVIEMGFDVVFMLRDRVPGLPELVLALGAVAAVSALLSFGVGVMVSRQGRASLMLLAALWLAAPPHARAFELRDDDELEIGADERVDDTLIATADRVDVDGVIDGDLIVAAERVSVRGTVNGSVYAFTRDLEISGHVRGNVVAGTERTRLAGPVGGSVYTATEHLTIADDGRVEADLLAWSDEATFDGGIGRDVGFVGKRLELRGPVGRDVDVYWAEALALRDGAHVRGDVDARLESDAIETSSGAVVDGETALRHAEGVRDHMLARYTEPGFYAFVVVRFAAAFLFGMLLFAVVPRLFDPAPPDARSFLRASGIGFLFVVAGPLAIACCALTVVGIPIAVMAGFTYLVALYAAKICVGALVGARLLGPPQGLVPFGLALLAGLGALTVATNVPFVGLPVAVVAVLFGIGRLTDRARHLSVS